MGKVFLRLAALGATLIGLFLFVNNSSETVKIIDSLGGTLNKTSKTLQGR